MVAEKLKSDSTKNPSIRIFNLESVAKCIGDICYISREKDKKMADSSQLTLSLILVWGRLQSPGYFTFLWKSWYLQCDWSPNKYRCIFTKSGQLWNICTQNTSKVKIRRTKRFLVELHHFWILFFSSGSWSKFKGKKGNKKRCSTTNIWPFLFCQDFSSPMLWLLRRAYFFNH